LILALTLLVDGMYKAGNFRAGESLRPTLDILVPRLLRELRSKEKGLDEIPFEKACKFSTSYYSLRDYIFISFANESSIGFSGDKNIINVTVNDPTVFRQIVYEAQTFFLNSMGELKSGLGMDKTVFLLKGTKQWDFGNPDLLQALESIELEVKWKVKHYFSHIPENSDIDMGGYLYREFIARVSARKNVPKYGM
jgi:hypothetical protein